MTPTLSPKVTLEKEKLKELMYQNNSQDESCISDNHFLFSSNGKNQVDSSNSLN